MMNMVVRYIWMYLGIGFVIYFGGVFYMSTRFALLSYLDWEIIDRAMDILVSRRNVRKNVKRMLETKDGRIRWWRNAIFNLLTWPGAMAFLLTRYPEAKKYILENRKTKQA